MTPYELWFSKKPKLSLLKVWGCDAYVKKFEITKVWNNCLACHRGCAWWEHSCMTKMEHGQTIWFCRDELSLAMLFWEDMIALISILEVLLFLCQYELLSWILWIWIFIPQLRRIALKLCQVSFHIKNYLFYHLPTQGRAGIKLGDVSTPPSLNLCLSSSNSVDKLKVIKKNFYKLYLLLLL